MTGVSRLLGKWLLLLSSTSTARLSTSSMAGIPWPNVSSRRPGSASSGTISRWTRSSASMSSQVPICTMEYFLARRDRTDRFALFPYLQGRKVDYPEADRLDCRDGSSRVVRSRSKCRYWHCGPDLCSHPVQRQHRQRAQLVSESDPSACYHGHSHIPCLHVDSASRWMMSHMCSRTRQTDLW